MSISYTGGTLLSSAGTQALQQFQSATSTNKYTGQTVNNLGILNSIDGGFANTSIFSNNASVTANYGNSSNYLGLTSHNYTAKTLDAGMLPGGTSCSWDAKISTFQRNGSSVIGNYYNSISNVALGQDAPTSVFEQRLNLAGIQTNKPGSMLGNFNNYYDVDTSGYTKAASANSVSSLMSMLA